MLISTLGTKITGACSRLVGLLERTWTIIKDKSPLKYPSSGIFHALHIFGMGAGAQDGLETEETGMDSLTHSLDDPVVIIEGHEDWWRHSRQQQAKDYNILPDLETRIRGGYFIKTPGSLNMEAEEQGRGRRSENLMPWSYIDKEKFMKPPQ